MAISTLNAQQVRAINCGMGPVIVVAGAGTGKTTVLTNRFAYLMNSAILKANDILCITFTNKAADEMRKRIFALVKDSTYPQWILTYHSLGLRILRDEIEVLGRNKNFVVIDEDDKLVLLREIYKKNNLDYKIIRYKKAIEIISDIKMEAIDFESLTTKFIENWGLRDSTELAMIKVFTREYMCCCLEQNLIDFDDLLVLSHKILKENDEIALRWQNKFKYILVDEFQDTNRIQFEILLMLIGKHQNVFVVGDPDQTIYTWRGAYAYIFEDFIKQFNPKQRFILDINYRSTQNILNIANSLISNDKSRIRKDLYSMKKENDDVLLYFAPTPFMEAAFIIQQIKLFVDTNQYQYKDVVILYRAKYQGRSIEQQLIQNNIPFYIHGDVQFYQRREIRDVIAYLRLLIDADNELAFRRIVNIPPRAIGQTTIDNITKQAIIANRSFMQEIKLSTNKHIVDFLQLMESLRQETVQFGIVGKIKYILNKIDYFSYLKTIDNESYEREQNITELLTSINEYEADHVNCTINDYLNDISLYVDKEKIVANSNQVHLMTIHYAKGTEYPVVFLIGLNQIRDHGIDYNEQEERRIIFVGITRAKSHLFLTCNYSTSIYGIELKPSRFIREFGEENYKQVFFETEKTALEHQSLDEPSALALNVGEIIEHKTFGRGVVVGIKGNLIDVMFSKPHELKTIMNLDKYIKKINLKN